MDKRVKEVSEQEFYQEIETGVTVVDFFADWCAPCDAQRPILDALASTVADDVNILAADVDQNQDIATKYGIMSIPTIVFFQNGKEVKRLHGVHSYNRLQQELESLAA